MNYIEENKLAWEEAFDQRSEGWGEDLVNKVRTEKYPFFYEEMIAILKKYDLSGKSIVQFCCNNGRELLSLVKTQQASLGVGFDIAQNQIDFANSKANELDLPCSFVMKNIYDISEEYYDKFDLAIITIGAICWFKDLSLFFRKVSSCLKANGTLIIHDQHPINNMFAAKGEDNFNEEFPTALRNSYFTKKWEENGGVYYITKKTYRSKTFTSFTHSFSEIINSIIENGMQIKRIGEYERDISGMFEHLQGQGLPLSFIIESEKVSP